MLIEAFCHKSAHHWQQLTLPPQQIIPTRKILQSSKTWWTFALGIPTSIRKQGKGGIKTYDTIVSGFFLNFKNIPLCSTLRVRIWG